MHLGSGALSDSLSFGEDGRGAEKGKAWLRGSALLLGESVSGQDSLSTRACSIWGIARPVAAHQAAVLGGSGSFLTQLFPGQVGHRHRQAVPSCPRCTTLSSPEPPADRCPRFLIYCDASEENGSSRQSEEAGYRWCTYRVR